MTTAAAQRATAVRSLPAELDRYTLLWHVGRGGMADIFLAREHDAEGRGRLVAIKAIREHLASQPRYRQMLLDEGRIASRVEHPNVVRTERVLEADGDPHLVMEYVEALDLRVVLRSCSVRALPLPFALSLCVVRQVLVALDHIHRMGERQGRPLGVVHRDVSPSNVLLSFDGRVKLCDFGIALPLRVGRTSTRDTIEGKAGYMSPEQARGDVIDARSDVYSVGIILWEMLSGRRFRRAKGSVTALQQAAIGGVPPLPLRGLPGEARLHAIVRKALARKLASRHASAGSMLRELDAWCLEHGMNASPGRLGAWLERHFSELIAAHRTACARSARDARGWRLRRSGSFPSTIAVAEPEATTQRSGARLIRRHVIAPAAPRRGFDELARVGALVFLLAFALLCALRLIA